MLKVNNTIDPYLARFDAVESDGAFAKADWFAPTRKAALAHFAESGFPTTRDEEWRFTNLAPITSTQFELGASASVTNAQIEPFTLNCDGTHRLVFVNGCFSPELSKVGKLPEGVRISSLATAMVEDRAVVEAHIAQYACFKENALTALNTAMMTDGAFVHVPRGCVLDQPVEILLISTAGESPTVSHPRNLFVVESSAQATIVETYAALQDNVYFTNPVTEIVAAENAVVRHYKIGRESVSAFHVATQQIQMQRNSNVSSHNVTIGGGIVRNDIGTRLAGEGCDCTLYGLTVIAGSQRVDNHLVVDHAMPHGDSREFYKGILDGRSRSVFSGRIIVRKDAQKTDAKQTNKSLLLSRDAQVESKPQLEILADDVKCTHGATIGQVNDEAVFYLRSRGVSEKAARNLLVHAFAREVIAEVRLDALRTKLDELLFEQLPQGAGLMEAL